MKRLFCLLGVLTLFSCSEDKVSFSSGSVSEPDGMANDLKELETTKPQRKGFGEKLQGNIHYNVNMLTAIEFIERKGERVADADRKQLENERVLLFEISLDDAKKDILKSEQLQLSEEEVMNYLVGEIASDFSIEQSGKSWKPTGVAFEGRSGAINKLRVEFFMGAIATDKPMKVLYYDRLMGQGLIKFGINE